MEGPADEAGSATPRFSVVIPTYQRREVVTASVLALARQQYDGPFEVIVVVDGSRDGSAEALRELRMPFPLTVLEQPNMGAAAARNRGAAVARGELLLFLDDDMEAHPRLLAEHERSYGEGAQVVLGHLPLHPDSPPSILREGVRSWADRRAHRLSAAGAQLRLDDLLTGQISLPRALFLRIGGFDADFTRSGTFGDEDVDLGYRLLRDGYRIVFNPDAISWQYYVVQPEQYLRQWHQAGHADVAFARKHPDQARDIFGGKRADHWTNRLLWRRLVALPLLGRPLAALLRWLVLALVRRGVRGARITRIFFAIRMMEYWRGVHDAGGIPQAAELRVLAYHAIADLGASARLAPYGIPAADFARQLDTLRRAGYQFIHPDEFVRFIRGLCKLPRKALLLTFDDCYEDLVEVALPLLESRDIPAVAFAVSERAGGHNDWDEGLGGPRLRLVDHAGLRLLAGRGVEIGAHSRTHRALPRLADDELRSEIGGAIADLEASGLPRPRLFSYPYGEWDGAVTSAVREAGVAAAFTVEPGLVRPDSDPYLVPRTEILRGDTGTRLLRKVAFGRTPAPLGAGVLRGRRR